jgi:8-oxo-dGTP diphosphatase
MSAKKVGKRGIFEAAGGVLWRITGGESQVAVVHRPRYDDWTLPKGTREKGESLAETALREVREETNCQAQLLDFAGCTWYEVEGILKIVFFWQMALDEEYEFRPNEEVDQLAWLTASQAMKKLDYESEKNLISRYQESIVST